MVLVLHVLPSGRLAPGSFPIPRAERRADTVHREKGKWEQQGAYVHLAIYGCMTAIALGLADRQQVATRTLFHPCKNFSENSGHCCSFYHLLGRSLQGDVCSPAGRKANGSPVLWTSAMEVTFLGWMAPSASSLPTGFGHGQPMLFNLGKETSLFGVGAGALYRGLESSLLLIELMALC